MKYSNRKSVFDDLKVYDYLAKDDSFIQVTEWDNEEGWDITIDNKLIQLSMGELEAINYLVKSLEFKSES